MITFNTDGMVAQRFPFPAPIMDYILKNLQPQHLVKLYQCCKFFYAKYRQNIILNLQIVANSEQETFDPTSTTVCVLNPVLEKLKDFWITDSFLYRGRILNVPHFTQCTIKKLELLNLIRWKEFVILTSAGTVQDMKVIGIFDSTYNFAFIEDIIAQVPNAKSIEIALAHVTPSTFTSLGAMDHKAKISNFVLRSTLTNIVKPQYDSIVTFMRKHADLDRDVNFCFISNDDGYFNRMIALELTHIKMEYEFERKQQEIKRLLGTE